MMIGLLHEVRNDHRYGKVLKPRAEWNQETGQYEFSDVIGR
jgi:hypothetical protein